MINKLAFYSLASLLLVESASAVNYVIDATELTERHHTVRIQPNPVKNEGADVISIPVAPKTITCGKFNSQEEATKFPVWFKSKDLNAFSHTNMPTDEKGVLSIKVYNNPTQNPWDYKVVMCPKKASPLPVGSTSAFNYEIDATEVTNRNGYTVRVQPCLKSELEVSTFSFPLVNQEIMEGTFEAPEESSKFAVWLCYNNSALTWSLMHREKDNTNKLSFKIKESTNFRNEPILNIATYK